MRDVAVAKKMEMGEQAITKIQDWHEDEVFFEYCSHPAVLPWVQSIIGPNVKSVHTMLINKPPDVGLGSSRHPPHQDLWYFPFRPANKIVCAWTAMQKIDTVNGCLFVKPGTHKGVLLKHEYPNDGIVNKAYHGVQGLSSEEEGKKMMNCVMEPGDTILFHPLLIHGSGRNNSTGFRKAISCHYAATECHYEDPHGTIQADIAKEIEEIRKKRKSPMTYVDYFRGKMRLVAGKEHTL
jgi:phytanoyl-CoA hydroxylase